jgi:hypothetical protein
MIAILPGEVKAPAAGYNGGMLCVVLLLAAPAAAARLEDRVVVAVERGRTWLRAELERGRFPHGSYPMGIRSLYLYALLEAGVDPEDPALRFALERVEALPLTQTYSVSLHLLALSAWARARGRGDPGALSRARELTAWLLAARAPGRAHWTYGPASDDTHDYSNTQFAVLGLATARRSRLEVPEEILKTIGETFVATREEPVRPESHRAVIAWADRTKRLELVPAGWGYRARGRAPFSMTCAGLANLAVAREAFPGAAGGPIDEAMRAAMVWIAVRWDELAKLRPGARHAQRRYYYTVYTLEKAGDLTGVVRFGRHDWYREEAEFLLRDQAEDGRWGRDGWEGVATSFALLFLTRATAPPPEETEELWTERQEKVGAALRAFLVPPPPAFDRDALAVLIEHGEEAVEAILARMTGSRADYRLFRALRAITGQDHGLDPAAWRKGLER